MPKTKAKKEREREREKEGEKETCLSLGSVSTNKERPIFADILNLITLVCNRPRFII